MDKDNAIIEIIPKIPITVPLGKVEIEKQDRLKIRLKVAKLRTKGMSYSKIYKKTGKSKPFIKLWYHRLKQTGSVADARRPGRPCTLSKEEIKIIVDAVKNPDIGSIRGAQKILMIKKKRRICGSTISRHLREKNIVLQKEDGQYVYKEKIDEQI